MKVSTQQLQPGAASKELSKFIEYLRRVWIQLITVVNGKIGFGDGTSSDNIDGVWAKPTSVAGNFTITHNLGRVPVGWLMVSTDAFENLKFISSTTTTITLAGQNGGAHLTLFIF